MDDEQPQEGPIQPWSSGSRQTPKSPPPEIKKLIAELGLRYPPATQADLNGRAGQLALLAVDLADMSPALLARAIKVHVSRSPYMPKASDLLQIAKGLMEADQPPNTVEKAMRLAEQRNAYLDRASPNFTARWTVDRNGTMSLVPKDQLDRRDPPRCTPAQAAEIMREFGIKSAILAPIVGSLAP